MHYRHRALALILHPGRTAPELLRHRTMARLAWDAVQTARAYLEHKGQVDEHFRGCVRARVKQEGAVLGFAR